MPYATSDWWYKSPVGFSSMGWITSDNGTRMALKVPADQPLASATGFTPVCPASVYSASVYFAHAVPHRPFNAHRDRDWDFEKQLAKSTSPV